MKITAHWHRPDCVRPQETDQHIPDDTNGRAITPKKINLGFFKLKIHRESALQSSLLAQVHFQRENEPTYFSEWDTWAEAITNPTEERAEAVRRMKAWVNARQFSSQLNLSGLGLTELPENLPATIQNLNISLNELTSLPENLPASIQNLNVAYNRLTSLPENLPASIQYLNVSANRLTGLPENLPASIQNLNVSANRLTGLPENLPASIQNLNVAYNRLTSLPENLPASIQYLDASRNELTSLPENLPTSLEDINVSVNRLISLPENITTSLTSNCAVEIINNPLPERVRNRLHAVTNAEGYSGPRFSFSMAASSDRPPARPLAEAVSDWYKEEEKGGINEKWSAFLDDEGAVAFSEFLDRLRGTVNYGNPKFRESVVEWLTHLVDHPELRRNTFLVSLGATATCEDRVSLTLNEMKKVRLAADIESGEYDNRLPELISLAKGMFRLDKLEKISREKVNSLSFVDEIEVYLAYQVKLRETLSLPLDTPDMRFFRVSWVTQDDLKKAEEDVTAAEKNEFVHYLSTDWQPWQSVLKRLHTKEFDEAQTKLLFAMDGEFSRRLNARLKEAGLENDSDAQRIVGPQVQADIAREINGELTTAFLNTHNLKL